MIVAIVQARLASRRYEGKVMKDVLGKPLIGYLLEKLKFSKYIKKVVLATLMDKHHDPMCDYARAMGVDVFRGSEDDVLDRYYQAALLNGAEDVVRITGDCPLIDIELCDKLFSMYLDLKGQIDYAHLSQKFAEGLDCEIFSFRCLESAWKEARMKSEREHVTLYFNNHLDRFRKKIMDNDTDDSKYRITVDEPEDFEVVKAIIEALYKSNTRFFGFQEIKRFLDEHPLIAMKNSHIIRNEGLVISLKNDKIVKKTGLD